MGKIIAVSNQKGGVGKTTTVHQLSDIFSNKNYGYGLKTLLFDFDPQGSLTSSMNISENAPGIYDFIINEKDTRIKISDTLDFISCNNADRISIELAGEAFKELCFADLIEDWLDEYDVILIDCPCENDFMNNSAYAAVDYIIVPITSDRYSLEGVRLLKQKVDKIKRFNKKIAFAGVLLVDVNKNTNSYKEALEDAKTCAKYLDASVYTSPITHSTVIENAQKVYKTLCQFNPKAKVSIEYLNFAQELMNFMRNC